MSPDFILLLFHLVSSHAPGSESSSFYRPIPNAYTSNSSCFDDDDDSIEHLLWASGIDKNNSSEQTNKNLLLSLLDS